MLGSCRDEIGSSPVQNSYSTGESQAEMSVAAMGRARPVARGGGQEGETRAWGSLRFVRGRRADGDSADRPGAFPADVRNHGAEPDGEVGISGVLRPLQTGAVSRPPGGGAWASGCGVDLASSGGDAGDPGAGRVVADWFFGGPRRGARWRPAGFVFGVAFKTRGCASCRV